jgi:hypothetical protein
VHWQFKDGSEARLIGEQAGNKKAGTASLLTLGGILG